MSALVRISQIFSVFGVGSTIPLTTIFAQDRLVNVSFSRQAGGGNQQSVTQSAGTAMDEAFKKLSEGNGSSGQKKWGCFWIPDFPETELFFCFDQNKLQTLTLFHWKSKGRELNEVQSITTRPITVQFERSGSQSISGRLSLLLGWTRRWPQETPFSPSAHCRISDNGQTSYKLTCTNPNPTPPNTKNPALDKTIFKSHIVEPKVSLKK